jgi:hypothetical protein
MPKILKLLLNNIIYPGKYIVEFSDGYSCTVEYAVINGLATPKELFRAGLPYYKVTRKD